MLDRYRIERKLGEGGTTEAFVVKPVAGEATSAVLKVLHVALAQRHGAVERFLAKARDLAGIEHPNVARVFECGTLPNGRPFLLMERLRGRDLATILRERGRLRWSRYRTMLLQICAGLRAVHAAGVIHGDIKPHNIYVEPGGVRLSNVGLAWAHDIEPRAQSRATSEMRSAFVGTPEYASPEQGTRARLDARADLYSLGVVSFQVLTGRLPFVAESWLDILAQHMYAEPPRPRLINATLPEEVEALVLRAMAKLPDDRFASVEELARVALSAPDDRIGVPELVQLDLDDDDVEVSRPGNLDQPRDAVDIARVPVAAVEVMRASKVEPVAPAPRGISGRRRSWIGLVAIVALLGLSGAWTFSDRDPTRFVSALADIEPVATGWASADLSPTSEVPHRPELTTSLPVLDLAAKAIVAARYAVPPSPPLRSSSEARFQSRQRSWTRRAAEGRRTDTGDASGPLVGAQTDQTLPSVLDDPPPPVSSGDGR